MDQQLIEKIIQETVEQFFPPSKKVENQKDTVPVAISARHIHLKQEHVEHLFGEGANLTVKKMLVQPGQFAANETLIIAGPKGNISNVRVLGPARTLTQVEISHTDAIKLGIQPPIRESGDIAGSASCTLIGPKGSLFLQEGVIIAQAHIHMPDEQAQQLQVKDGEFVSVKINSLRPVTFEKVKIRVKTDYELEMHIDTDEANAGLIQPRAVGTIVKPSTDITETTFNFVNKKVITEQDVVAHQGEILIVPHHAILTALAKEAVTLLGKEIQYKKDDDVCV